MCCSVLQCVAVTYANSKSRTTLTSASTFTISLLFLHARIFAANSTRLSASSSSIVITRGGIFRAAISLSCLSLASLWLKNKKSWVKQKTPYGEDEFYANSILVCLVLVCGLGLGVRHNYVQRKCAHKGVQHKCAWHIFVPNALLEHVETGRHAPPHSKNHCDTFKNKESHCNTHMCGASRVEGMHHPLAKTLQQGTNCRAISHT